MNKDVNSIWNVKGKRFCHPGFDTSNEWTKAFSTVNIAAEIHRTRCAWCECITLNYFASRLHLVAVRGARMFPLVWKRKRDGGDGTLSRVSSCERTLLLFKHYSSMQFCEIAERTRLNQREWVCKAKLIYLDCSTSRSG